MTSPSTAIPHGSHSPLSHGAMPSMRWTLLCLALISNTSLTSFPPPTIPSLPAVGQGSPLTNGLLPHERWVHLLHIEDTVSLASITLLNSLHHAPSTVPRHSSLTWQRGLPLWVFTDAVFRGKPSSGRKDKTSRVPLSDCRLSSPSLLIPCPSSLPPMQLLLVYTRVNVKSDPGFSSLWGASLVHWLKCLHTKDCREDMGLI